MNLTETIGLKKEVWDWVGPVHWSLSEAGMLSPFIVYRTKKRGQCLANPGREVSAGEWQYSQVVEKEGAAVDTMYAYGW